MGGGVEGRRKVGTESEGIAWQQDKRVTPSSFTFQAGLNSTFSILKWFVSGNPTTTISQASIM